MPDSSGKSIVLHPLHTLTNSQPSAQTSIRLDDNVEMVGIKYYPQTSSPITDFSFYMMVNGTVTGINFRASVQSDSVDIPSGTVLGATNNCITPEFAGLASSGAISLQTFNENSGNLTRNVPVWIVIYRSSGSNLDSSNYITPATFSLVGMLLGQAMTRNRHYNGSNWTTSSPINYPPIAVLKHQDGTYVGLSVTSTIVNQGCPDIQSSNKQGLVFRVGSQIKISAVALSLTRLGSPNALVVSVYEGSTLKTSETVPADSVVSGVYFIVWLGSPPTIAAGATCYIILSQSGTSDSNDYDLRGNSIDSSFIETVMTPDCRMVYGTSEDPANLTRVTDFVPQIAPLIFDSAKDLFGGGAVSSPSVLTPKNPFGSLLTIPFPVRQGSLYSDISNAPNILVDAAGEKIAAKFFAMTTSQITDVDLVVNRVGDCSGINWTLAVHNDNSDEPGTILGAATSAFAGPSTGLLPWLGGGTNPIALGTPTGALSLNTPYWLVLDISSGTPDETHYLQMLRYGVMCGEKTRAYTSGSWTSVTAINFSGGFLLKHADGSYSGCYIGGYNMSTSAEDIYSPNKQGIRFKCGSHIVVAGVSFHINKTGSPNNLVISIYEGSVLKDSVTYSASFITSTFQHTAAFNSPVTIAANTYCYIIFSQSGTSNSNDYELRVIGVHPTYFGGMAPGSFRFVYGTSGNPTELSIMANELPVCYPVLLDTDSSYRSGLARYPGMAGGILG